MAPTTDEGRTALQRAITQVSEAVPHVLREVRTNPILPAELIARVQHKADLPEAAIREAIWEMLDDGRLLLAEDRRLEPGSPAASR